MIDVTKLKAGDWEGFARAVREDIAVVREIIDRDDTGIYYEVRVALRSLAAQAYEEGEDSLTVWSTEVGFGQTDATVAGGAAFVAASREQDRVAETIAMIARGAKE